MSQDYKVPNRKKWLLNEEFLFTLKHEIAKETNDDLEGKNYWNYFAHIDDKVVFYNALKQASIKHNVVKAIYEYTVNIDWYKSDQFISFIFERMIDSKVIEEGDAGEYLSMYNDSMEQLGKNGEIEVTEEIKHHNGYSVKVKNWKFTDSFKNR